MSANKLGGRMHHDVCSMFKRTEKEWGGKSVIYNYRNAMAMGNFRYSLYIRYIRVRVSEGFHKHGLCVGLYGVFQRFQIIRPNNGVGDALSGKRMCDEVV